MMIGVTWFTTAIEVKYIAVAMATVAPISEHTNHIAMMVCSGFTGP